MRAETAVLADRVTDALWTLRAACTDDDDRHLVDTVASQLYHRFQSAIPDRAANQQVPGGDR